MPQRFLRPGITHSRRFNAIDWQAQSFFVRLITLVDDYGRFEADPTLLASLCFPMNRDITPAKIIKLCEQLQSNELVEFYELDGTKYLQLTRWQERARAKSKYPDPPDNKCCQMLSIDNKCSPPKPSPSPSPTSKPLSHSASHAIIPECLNDPEFLAEWENFKIHRKNIKKPMTQRAEELLLNKLKDRPNDALSAIQMCITKGWQSIEWSWYDKTVGQEESSPQPRRELTEEEKAENRRKDAERRKADEERVAATEPSILEQLRQATLERLNWGSEVTYVDDDE